jgi:hypothetical protein
LFPPNMTVEHLFFQRSSTFLNSEQDQPFTPSCSTVEKYFSITTKVPCSLLCIWLLRIKMINVRDE